MRLGGRKEGHSVCKTRLFSFASTPAKGRIMKDVKRTHIKILLLDWKCQYSSLQCIFYITKSTKKPWITYFNYRYIYTCLPWPNKKSISLFFRYLPICQVHYFLWEYCYQKTVQCHNISSVIRQEDESQNQNNKKTKHVKCFEKQVFLTFDTLIMGGVGDKCLFFGKFGGLCFLVTSVLRFALSPYYWRFKTKSDQKNFQRSGGQKEQQITILFTLRNFHDSLMPKTRSKTVADLRHLKIKE